MAVNAHARATDYIVAEGQPAVNFTAAGGPYYWVFPAYQYERIGWQGIKSTTAGAGTWTFFVTLAPTRRESDIRPDDGTVTGALPQIWQPDPGLVFAADPINGVLWNPLPLQASGFAWTWVLGQLDVSVDILRSGLNLFFSGG